MTTIRPRSGIPTPPSTTGVRSVSQRFDHVDRGKSGSASVPENVVAREIVSRRPTEPVSRVAVEAPHVHVINVIDRSTQVDAASFESMVEACRIQLENHVAPLWGKMSWQLVVNQPEDVGFPIVVVDDGDAAGRMGFHAQLPNGKSWGRVFVKSVLDGGGTILRGPLSVSAILSHEVAESYCDPGLNLWAVRPDGHLVAHEVVDPVEDDFYDVTVASGIKVSVSNFVLPAWFDGQSPLDSRFDYMGRLKKPFSMTKGGYTVTMNPQTGIVKNVFASEDGEQIHNIRQQPHPASRSTRKRDGITAV